MRLEGIEPWPKLREGGWIFQIELYGGAKDWAVWISTGWTSSLSVPCYLRWGPILMISLLSASFSFSALELGTGKSLDMRHEFRSHGTANIVSGLGLGLPGLSDVAASVMYRRMGATSRVTPLVSGALCLVAAHRAAAYRLPAQASPWCA